MNYYNRHLGDYSKDTAHLTMVEHGAYSLLLDRYYSTEAPIPADQVHRLARARSPEECAAVDSVLSEFFLLVDGFWVNNRAQEEITKAQARISAASENGKRGGRPRNNPALNPNERVGFSLGLPNESQTKAKTNPEETQVKAHQSPNTNNHIVSASRKTRLPERTTPRASHFEKAKALGLNLVDEVEKFRDYHQAKGTMFADWDAALHSWLRNAVNFRRTNAVVTADPYGLQGAL